MSINEDLKLRKRKGEGRQCEGSVNRGSIGSQVTRIPRRGLEEGRGKDMSIYIVPSPSRAPDWGPCLGYM